LEGIFSGSADIKAHFPFEITRFQSISSEFLTLMKKVLKSPMVVDVLNIVGVQRSLENFLSRLRHVPLDSALRSKNGGAATAASGGQDKQKDKQKYVLSQTMQVQRDVANILDTYLTPDGLVSRCLDYAATNIEHVMDFTRSRATNALFSMLNQEVRNVLNYNHTHPDFPMQPDQLESYIPKALIYSVLWSFAGDGNLKGKPTFFYLIYILIYMICYTFHLFLISP